MVMKQLIPEVFIDYDPYGGGFYTLPGTPSYTPPPVDSIYKGQQIPETITRAQPLIKPKVAPEPKVEPKPTLQPGILDFKTYDLDKPGGLVNQKNILMPKMGPFTPATTPSKSKNQQLGLMLYALGGALRGDKNFVEKTMQLQQMQESKKKQEEQNKLWEKFKKESTIDPQITSLGDMMNPNQRLELMMKTISKDSDEQFKGQGITNQFMNVLLKGQRDESVRQTSLYKTAFDYLSQPKTETYINEVGQQVTRTIPGMISREDYLPPVSVAAVDEKPVVTEPKEEEIVKVDPERRKTLQTQIDTVDNSERKILAFQKKLDEIKPNPLTRGEDRADIQSSYTSLLLELKNLEQLGVLAGPDLDLLQSMVGDPTGFQQFFIAGGTAGINKQLNNLLQSIRDRKTPIYKELGMEEPEGTITQTTQTAYLKGRKIEVNVTGDGWIYSDTGEAVEQ